MSDKPPAKKKPVSKGARIRKKPKLKPYLVPDICRVLYVRYGRTLKQISENYHIPLRALENTSSRDGWPVAREEETKRLMAFQRDITNDVLMQELNTRRERGAFESLLVIDEIELAIVRAARSVNSFEEALNLRVLSEVKAQCILMKHEILGILGNIETESSREIEGQSIIACNELLPVDETSESGEPSETD